MREVWIEDSLKGSRLPGLGQEEFQTLRRQTDIFSGVEGYQMRAATITGSGEPAIVSGPRISPGTFQMLRVVPKLGRLFNNGDTDPGARVTLISEGLWSRRFGRAQDVIGQRLIIDGEAHAIVGVLPSRFAFPEQRAELWRPIQIDPKGNVGRISTVVWIRPDSAKGIEERLKIVSARSREEGLLVRDRRFILQDLVQRTASLRPPISHRSLRDVCRGGLGSGHRLRERQQRAVGEGDGTSGRVRRDAGSGRQPGEAGDGRCGRGLCLAVFGALGGRLVAGVLLVVILSATRARGPGIRDGWLAGL
jgi:MacB-like periplasmic core domain